MGGGLRRLDNTGGWGGRDRTSEWRNQNPLPYRLATPQLRGDAEDRATADSPQVLPVYRERRGISTAWRGKIPHGPNDRPPHFIMDPGGFAPGRRHPRLPAIETAPVSWEYGANIVHGSEP